MSPVGATTLSILLCLVLFAPPRWALLGIFGGVLYMTLGQAIVLLGFNIYPTRLLTLAALVRVLMRGEFSVSMLTGIDRLLLLTFGYQTVVFLLNDNGSAINITGQFIDVMLAYFSCRGLLRSFEDLTWFLHALVILLLPYVALLYVEASTGTNPFASIGGVSSHDVRGGFPRCIGSFGHAAILGTFGASFLPLYIALLIQRKNLTSALLGICICLAIVVFSNSGGPLACAALALIGMLFWPLRRNMPTVRAWIAAAFLMIVILMEAPVWYLPAKISDFSGGDGWHRSYLMEVAFSHIDQWWLAGMSVLATRDWFPYTVVTGGADIINYYLGFGISAGVAAIGLFCSLLVRAFSLVGTALGTVRLHGREDRRAEILLWALGVVLTVHTFNWFGMVYFDQYYVAFFMQFAALATLASKSIDQKADPVGEYVPARRATDDHWAARLYPWRRP